MRAAVVALNPSCLPPDPDGENDLPAVGRYILLTYGQRYFDSKYAREEQRSNLEISARGDQGTSAWPAMKEDGMVPKSQSQGGISLPVSI